MKFRRTLIFGAIFLALAAYVFFFEFKGTEHREAAKRESEALLSFKKENVAEVKLTYPDRRIHCVRDSADLWRLIEPIETEGSWDDIKQVLTSLEETTIRRTVVDSAARLSDYGLDAPRVTACIRQENEETWRSVTVGDTNPTGSFVYARKEEKSAVFLVPMTLFSALDKGVYDLRLRKVLEFKRENITHISLSRRGESIVCSKSLDEWRLLRPIQARADGDEIDAIVRKLHEAEVKAFVAEKVEDPALYGLDRPHLRVDLFAGETEAAGRLTIGKRQGGTFYARDASRNPVFTVDSSLVSALEKDVSDLRDRSIMAVKPYRVQELRLQTETLDLLCRKDTTGTWHILEPIRVRADESEINDLLWDLEGLKAEAFVSDAPGDLSPYGLDEPRVQMTLRMEADSTARTLSVGKKSGERVYVKNGAAPSVYLVASEFLEELGDDTARFRYKKILDFYTYEVRDIEIVHGEETSLWKKDSKEDWVGPGGRSVKKSDMTGLLNDLQSLRAEEFVDDDPSDLSQYGLADPRYTVTLRFKEKPAQVLFVGDEAEAGSVFVRNGDTTSVFGTKSDFVEKLNRICQES